MYELIYHCGFVAPVFEYPFGSVAVLDIEFEFHKWHCVGVYLQDNRISAVAVFVIVGHIVLFFAVFDTIFLDIVGDGVTKGRVDIGVETVETFSSVGRDSKAGIATARGYVGDKTCFEKLSQTILALHIIYPAVFCDHVNDNVLLNRNIHFVEDKQKYQLVDRLLVEHISRYMVRLH